jgi:hypothetical protein
MTHLATLDVPTADSDALAGSTRIGLTDFHSHFVTSRYGEKCIAAGHDASDGTPWWPARSVEEHQAHIQARGISQAVLSISSPGVHFGDDVAAAELNARAPLEKPASDHWKMGESHR